MNIFAGQWSLHHPLPRTVTRKKDEVKYASAVLRKSEDTNGWQRGTQRGRNANWKGKQSEAVGRKQDYDTEEER